jgi:hypothetical protein
LSIEVVDVVAGTSDDCRGTSIGMLGCARSAGAASALAVFALRIDAVGGWGDDRAEEKAAMAYEEK